MPEPLIGDRLRGVISRAFRFLEDIIFIGLGVLLAGSALYLLGAAGVEFGQKVIAVKLGSVEVVNLVEDLLLILLVVEILYTVQVSFREHTLAPEPFLLVGLIAAVRRVLVITAELAEVKGTPADTFQALMIELGVLTGLILVLVVSVVMLRRRGDASSESRRGD